MKLYLKRWSRALRLPRVLKGAAVGAHCKPCAPLEGLVGVLLPCAGKTVIRLCRSRQERLFKNCFNMAVAITLSELAWIFKRELAIMISLCRFSFCFYFSQKKKEFRLSTKFSWGFCLDLLCPTHLSVASMSALGRIAKGTRRDGKPHQQNYSYLILLSGLMSATPKEVADQPGPASRGAEHASLPCCSVPSLLRQSSLRGDPMGRERGDEFSAGWEQSPKGHLPAAGKTAVRGGWKLWDFRQPSSPGNTFSRCSISKVANVSHS